MKKQLSCLAAALLAAAPASGAEHTVGQKAKQFTSESLTVKVGDVVHFENQDPFFHNVFSLSDAATFDLGSYPQGESKSVTFEQAGKVEVECAIHPNMRMVVEVKE
jgi:plastocyanin